MEMILSSRSPSGPVLDPRWLTLMGGDGLAACRAFDAALRADPDDLWLRRGLGLAFAEREIEVRALAVLMEVARAAPGHAETWYWIGQFAPRDTHSAVALEAFERATDADPDVADYWSARAGRESGERALASLRIALQLDPDHTEALVLTAWIHEQDGDLRRVIEVRRRLEGVSPSPSGARALAAALRAAGDHDAAANAAHDAHRMERRRPLRLGPPGGGFGLVAALLLERGLLDGLMTHFLSRGGSEPAAPAFWWGAAAAQAARGRLGEALALVDALVGFGAESPLGLHLERDRAVLLHALGRDEEARTAWELMRMHRDFARFERSGLGALAVGADGGASLGWATAGATIEDPWTARVRPFRPGADAD